MCFSALIGGATALLGARSSSRASSAQQNAANQQLAMSQQQFDATQAQTEPYREAGEQGLSAYLYNLGLGDQPEGYEGLQETPNYLWQLGAGRDTIEGGAAGRGNLYSGATLGSLERFRQGLTSSEANTQLNRLAGIAGQGLSATGMNAQAGQANVAYGSNALGNLGDARAAGAIGRGNAISQGINSGLGAYGFFGGGNAGNSSLFNPLFGGSGLGGFT